jgi:hypothetical protein
MADCAARFRTDAGMTLPIRHSSFILLTAEFIENSALARIAPIRRS